MGGLVLEIWNMISNPATIASFIALGIAAHSEWRRKQESKKHTKIASAQLILRLREPWHKPEFKQLLREIQRNTVIKNNEHGVEEFLNQMEDIAVFWKDGVLTDQHVKEMFGANLKNILNNEHIYRKLKKCNNENPQYTFVNLLALLEKVKSWNV